MSTFFQKAHSKKPVCTIKSKAEKGHYGEPHLVLLRDQRFAPDTVTLKILRPYFETYTDEEDGKKKEWLTWIDCDGEVFLPIDDLLPIKWMLLGEVDKQVFDVLGLVPPSEKQWKKVMT